MIKILNAAETTIPITKASWQSWRNALSSSSSYPTLSLLLMRSVRVETRCLCINDIHHKLFQNETIKRYLKKHAEYIVQTIIVQFERRYSNLGVEKYGFNINPTKVSSENLCVLRQLIPALWIPAPCNSRETCLGKYWGWKGIMNWNGLTFMILNDEYFAIFL